MKKKWLIGLASLCMAFATFGFIGCGDGGNGNGGDDDGSGSGSGEGASQGSLEYVLSDDGTYYTVKGIGSFEGTDIVIPSDYQGKPVQAVKAHAFNGVPGITSVVIGDKVEVIEDNNFKDCANLTSIVIGASVAEIGQYSLWGNDLLANIDVADANAYFKDVDGDLYTKDGKTLLKYSVGKAATAFVSPEGLETVAEKAFDHANNLTSVEIDCKTIGKMAFSFCANLTSVKLGDEVTEIGEQTFHGCKKLAKVELGVGLEIVKTSAFHECYDVTEVYYHGTAADWCGIAFEGNSSNPKLSAGKLYFYNGVEYELLGDTLIIPDTVTEIKGKTFNSCNIKNIVIGASVSVIEGGAFPFVSGQNVYFKCAPTEEMKNKFSSTAKFFYYIENEENVPNDKGYYWHYVGGVPTAW